MARTSRQGMITGSDRAESSNLSLSRFVRVWSLCDSCSVDQPLLTISPNKLDLIALSFEGFHEQRGLV